MPPAGAGSDRAVSELTSALALVGVTLLIVAAIGSSVVFLEERDSGPSGQFGFDYRDDSQRLLVTYEGGDTFEAGNVSIQGPNDASARWSELAGAEPSATIEQGETVPVGEGGAYGQSVGSEDSIRVVYIGPETGSATVLDQWNGTNPF
ncbi:MAG: type IV pilin [Halapricum sp.]